MPWLLAPVYDRCMAGTEEACLNEWRREVLRHASGRVIEVGSGTGINIGLYPDAVTSVVLSEPDPWMRKGLSKRLHDDALTIYEVSSAGVEDLAYAADTFDTVVCTLVLCTVPDPQQALDSIHRILKPGGRLIFLEHVLANDRPKRARWQRFWNPLWKRCMGGCEVIRDTATSMESAGFQIETMTRASMRKAPSIVRPTIRGYAIKPV